MNWRSPPALAVLSHLVPGLRVGGETALAGRSIRHHVRAREKLVLRGRASRPLPGWFAAALANRMERAALHPAAEVLENERSGRQD